MSKPLLVIVNGPPGAGKTTLGRKLAQETGLPFISKDDIKEILFDILGWEDREWSKKLGHASMEILFHLAECELRAGRSALLETAFHVAFHTGRFLDLASRYGCEFLQIYCRATEQVLYERLQKRVRSGERHPGHSDPLLTFDQFREILERGTYSVLEIGGSLIEIDTGDLAKVDCTALIAAILSRSEWRELQD